MQQQTSQGTKSMGTASGGGRKRQKVSRTKQRINMSFFLVVMFFAVFGIIVLTEILFIDERGRGGGVLVRHGSLAHNRPVEKTDYEDAMQSDDYITLRGGANFLNHMNLEDSVGALLQGGRIAAIPVIEDETGRQGLPILEGQLPGYPQAITPADGMWQIVVGTRYKFFVFSAFYDARKKPRNVRIIGATKTRSPEKVWCRLWYRSAENSTAWTSRTVAAKVKVIRENWNLKYSACFILCPLQKNMTMPQHVSVVARFRAQPTNLLIVNKNYNETNFHQPSGFAVCVKPLHFDYNRAIQILEFIELHRILGVEHFTFYNHTIGPQVGCLLEDYVAKGLVTLLPWQLNMKSQKEIRTEGLFAALNDCLYRNMYKYSHVLLIDLDEYIIPRQNDTLAQFIDYMGTRIKTQTTGSFSIQNAFFYLQWGDDPWVYGSNDPVAASLVTLKKTRRRSKLHPHKQRSKYICRPELVVEAGNHFVWEFIPGHGTFNVNPDSAILHHYRVCEYGGDDCVKTASTVDTTAFRYRDRLVTAVRSKYQQFKTQCDLLDLPPPPPSLPKS